MIRGDVVCTRVAQLEPSQPVMDTGLQIIEILIFKQRPLDIGMIRREPVGLGRQVVLISVPLKERSHEDGPDISFRISIYFEMTPIDAEYLRHIGQTQSEQSAELMNP